MRPRRATGRLAEFLASPALVLLDSGESPELGAADVDCTCEAGASCAAIATSISTIHCGASFDRVTRLDLLARFVGRTSLVVIEAGGLGRQATANCSEASKSSKLPIVDRESLNEVKSELLPGLCTCEDGELSQLLKRDRLLLRYSSASS